MKTEAISSSTQLPSGESDPTVNGTTPSPIGMRALLPIVLIIIVDTIGFGILMPLLPFYTERTGASAFTVGALISVYAFCSFIAAPFLGQLSDRYGRKPILIISQVGSMVGYVMFAMSNTLWLLFVARIIDGLSAGNMSVAQAYVADNSSHADRTRAFGITGAALGVGFLIGPATGGLLAVRNIHAPLWVAAGLSALSILGTLVLLPKGRLTSPATGVRHQFPAEAMIATFRAPETTIIACLIGLLYFAFGTYMSGQALFLAGRFEWHGHPFNATNVGLVFTYGSLINVLVQAVVMKRLTLLVTEKKILIAGFLMMGIGYTGIGLSSALIVLLGFVTIANAGSAMLRPIVLSQLSKRTHPSRQGLALGVHQAIFSTTAILSPLLSGALINKGLYRSWTLCAGAVVFVGAITASTLKPAPALVAASQ